MPAHESSMLLVARFLKTQGYNASYQAFVLEANLPEHAGDITSTGLTLEKLLEEKRLFDQSSSFEKLSIADQGEQGWSEYAPSRAILVDTLPSPANLLSAVMVARDDGGEQVLASTSDRRISVIDMESLALQSSWVDIQDSPVLSQIVLGKYHISASMSGGVVVASLETGKAIQRRKDHTKYVVALTLHHDTQPLLASAGWDNVINVYAIYPQVPTLSEPLASIALSTKPEALLFTKHPDTSEPVLVVTRTDSSYLYFYAPRDGKLLGRQNLAPHSNAWVAFTPTSIALCPSDSSVIAVATNSVPHMKLIIVRLLIPRTAEPVSVPQTAREDSVMQQRIADQEHNAIRLHCNTMSSQTSYSSPLVVWRPDSKGVWVNSDDGVIRGIDVLSGKVVSELKYHEPGTKVRTLWAGMSNINDKTEEVLISGGFDHKLIIWKP